MPPADRSDSQNPSQPAPLTPIAERFKDRRVIVTGAASGIGKAAAERFLAEGAKVLAVDLPGTPLADLPNSQRLVRLEKSVADDDAADAIVAKAEAAFGGVDVLVNNAGTAASVLAEQMPAEEWDREMAVNLSGPFRICQAAIPHLKQAAGGGRIVNIASVAALYTDWGLSAYCASKSGLLGLTRTLAWELGKFGITANAILPGAIRTGMTEGNFQNPEIAAVWAKKSPLRRLGAPEDLAAAILFLASPDARFITGQSIQVDGGMLLRM